MIDLFDDPVFDQMHEARIRAGLASVSVGEIDPRRLRPEGNPRIAVGLREGDEHVYVCHVDALSDPYPWIMMTRDEFREHWPHCRLALELQS